MSHEFRTPMHAILSYSKMGLTDLAQAENKEIEIYFQKIRVSGERLIKLINDLLDMSKLEAGGTEFQFTINDFTDVIQYTITELESLLEAKEIRTLVKIDTKSTRAVFDKLRMIQVMVNLVSNAIKFAPNGSNIFIHLSDARLRTGEEALICSVADEGSGIPENELEVVFDKFVQSTKTSTGAGGTGLGLSICREIVEAHGGKIWAQNMKVRRDNT